MRSYFNKIFGNDALKKRIGAAVDSSKIPHAMLIVGDEGTGKLTMAKEIAAALNISRSYVSRIEKAALEKIAKNLERMPL